MPNRFDKFIHDENIKNFSKQIETETDPVRLPLLKTLLSEERAARVVSGRRRRPTSREACVHRPFRPSRQC